MIQSLGHCKENLSTVAVIDGSKRAIFISKALFVNNGRSNSGVGPKG